MEGAGTIIQFYKTRSSAKAGSKRPSRNSVSIFFSLVGLSPGGQHQPNDWHTTRGHSVALPSL